MSVEELKQLQQEIIRKNKKGNRIGLIVFIILTLLTIVFFKMKNIPLFYLLVTSPFTLLIYLFVIMYIKSKSNGNDIETFHKEFKNVFVLKSLKNIFEDIKYIPEKGFSEEFVDKIGMIDTGDSYQSNDYISGKYKNISFQQSDVHIQERREEENLDGEMEEEWVTTFMGRLMIFDFNKNFKANIQVTNWLFVASELPWSKKFSKVRMEDNEFNNLFNVYAENEHEAFYILTPHFMEKIKELTSKLKCGILLGFVNNKLHIAVDNYTDSFEYSVYKPINEQEIEESITKDIKLITDFVDELDLDNDLFKS